MTSTARAFVDEAALHVGYREGRDPDGNWNNDNIFGRWAGANRVAWCHYFVSWVAHQTGNLGIIPKTGWCPAGLDYFRARDETGVFPPRAGDIGYLRRRNNDGSWSTPHVFIVESWEGSKTAGWVHTIEGNTNLFGSPQGNGVYRLQRADNADNPGLIYARPDYAATTPSGGQGGTIPKPQPKPQPTPKPPARGPITVANLRKGKTNQDVARLRKALRETHGAAYIASLDSTYDSAVTTMTRALYDALGKTDPTMREKPGEAPWDEPGAELLRRLGFDPK